MTITIIPDNAKPHQALAYIDQFTQSIKMDRIEAYNLNKAFEIVRSALIDNPKIDIKDLCLNLRATHALNQNDVKTIDDLLKLTSKDLLRTPDAGKITLKHIKEALAVYDLKLRDDQWPA